MREISENTLRTVKQALCADCGAGCSHPELCDEFVRECLEMEEEDD